MFYDHIDFPNLPLADWQKFRKEPSPYLFEKVIDRDETCLPPWFVPLARGIAIASDYLLQRRLGCNCGMSRPPGWREDAPGYFKKRIRENNFLVVWNCDKSGLHTVERISEWPQKIDEVLVYQVGWTPVFTRTAEEAMELAMHCHANGPPPGFRWLKTDPTKNISAIEIAKATPDRVSGLLCNQYFRA